MILTRRLLLEQMMTQTTGYLYLAKDNNILMGEPIVQGTPPVRAIVESWRIGI
jgi:uncharacterized protein (DUF433 family)